MRPLDDILVGFIIFFILERVIRLVGVVIFEPIIMSKTNDEKVTKNWVQFIDIVFLATALFLVIRFKKQLARIT